MAEVADLTTLMSNINVLMYEASTSNRYATFFYGQYHPVSRRLRYVNAGHNAPMLVRGKKCIRLEAGGPVVGLLQDAQYEQAWYQLEPGDILVGYTDGISEAMTEADEEWGEESLLEAIRTCAHRPAKEMIDFILHEADIFTTGAPQYDDMTLSVTKVH
jgi:sigma-B regulation protein RsbU (phosphoserine phosphatase)